MAAATLGDKPYLLTGQQGAGIFRREVLQQTNNLQHFCQVPLSKFEGLAPHTCSHSNTAAGQRRARLKVVPYHRSLIGGATSLSCKHMEYRLDADLRHMPAAETCNSDCMLSTSAAVCAAETARCTSCSPISNHASTLEPQPPPCHKSEVLEVGPVARYPTRAVLLPVTRSRCCCQ